MRRNGFKVKQLIAAGGAVFAMLAAPLAVDYSMGNGISGAFAAEDGGKKGAGGAGKGQGGARKGASQAGKGGKGGSMEDRVFRAEPDDDSDRSSLGCFRSAFHPKGYPFSVRSEDIQLCPFHSFVEKDDFSAYVDAGLMEFGERANFYNRGRKTLLGCANAPAQCTDGQRPFLSQVRQDKGGLFFTAPDPVLDGNGLEPSCEAHVFHFSTRELYRRRRPP